MKFTHADQPFAAGPTGIDPNGRPIQNTYNRYNNTTGGTRTSPGVASAVLPRTTSSSHTEYLDIGGAKVPVTVGSQSTRSVGKFAGLPAGAGNNSGSSVAPLAPVPGAQTPPPTKPTVPPASSGGAASNGLPKGAIQKTVLMIDPVTKQLVQVSATNPMPTGATTPTQAGSVNTPTQTMRNAASQAEVAIKEIPRIMTEIDTLSPKLGPITGRWNEFWQGKLGMEDPDFAGLHADLSLLASAVSLAHARGRLPIALWNEFQNMINAPKQTPDNLKSTLTKVNQWMVDNRDVMMNPSGAGEGGNSGKVHMWSPDGRDEMDVEPSQVAHYQSLGATTAKPTAKPK